MKPTPFHERAASLNHAELWEHWAGFLAATRYGHSAMSEYYALRTTVGVVDVSPLFKYRIVGPDAVGFLSGILTRDLRRCGVGEAQYTAWCDDRGFVVEDGLVLRVSDSEYLMTTARPNLWHLERHRVARDVEVHDVSDSFGLLALQGPKSAAVLSEVLGGSIDLPYFGVGIRRIGDASVLVSRTGYTGDLGYELWVSVDDATAVWDSIAAAGSAYGLTPVGLQALDIARIEAGLVQIGVDYTSARFARTPAECETPTELGLGWMLRGIADTDRVFVGLDAIRRERRDAATRWTTVGLELDIDSYDQVYSRRGLIPPKQGVLLSGSLGLYSADLDADPTGGYVGYATSLAWSPVLMRHIALAKVPLDLATPGSEVYLETNVVHRPRYVAARVAALPFYEPPRKRASTGAV